MLWNLDDISTMAACSQREQQNQQNPTLKKPTANAKMANVGINAHVTDAGPDCNIGCLCSGDPLKCNRFTIE